MNDIISKVSESDILSFYLGINEIPIVINSPLRIDERPSFGLYSRDGKKIYYTDLSTGEKGNTFSLLSKMWNCSYNDVLLRINKDIPKMKHILKSKSSVPCTIQKISLYNKNTDLQCKTREWKDYDIEYWSKYGITLKWLKYAEVYPISHKIVIKNGRRYTFPADKLAYAYVEHKDNETTLKIYQPLNKNGYKWCNKHNNSVISLWTKVPPSGEHICICSSLKDALCLWINTGIPSIAVQGEGYTMSNTAINKLKERYKHIYILFDNDKPGLLDGKKLSDKTGFINIVLPTFEGGKDVSDLMKIKGRSLFILEMLKLFPFLKNTVLYK